MIQLKTLCIGDIVSAVNASSEFGRGCRMTNAFIEKWYDKNAARYTEEIENIFYAVAYAAQRFLIDEACEWLKNEAYFSVNDNTGCLDHEDLISRFRKAMEE